MLVIQFTIINFEPRKPPQPLEAHHENLAQAFPPANEFHQINNQLDSLSSKNSLKSPSIITQ